LFAQYLEQGVFEVTRNFLIETLPKLGKSETDQALKLILFSKLDSTCTADLAEAQEEYVPYPFSIFFSSFLLFQV